MAITALLLQPDDQKMNQLCKVCGEPAAGFHFGAFTCEGCKSFFGRTYNNLSSLNECKNSGRCVINKKTRTSCKSCRLRKCLMVGMSKSGSRYGRRSNWFKIHYLMQGSNGPSAAASAHGDLMMPGDPAVTTTTTATSTATATSPGLLSPPPEPKTLSPDFRDFKDFKLSPDFKIGSDFKPGLDCKGLNSPTPSSSESHNSDSSLELGEKPLFPPYPEHLYPKDLLALYNLPTLTPHIPPYVAPASLAHRYLYPYYPHLLSVYTRRQYLDSLLQKARQSEETPVEGEEEEEAEEEEEEEEEGEEGEEGEMMPRCLVSPKREFPPPSKMFKPNSIRLPPPLRGAAVKGPSPVRGVLPLRQEPPARDVTPGCYNPGHDLTPSRGSPEDQEEAVPPHPPPPPLPLPPPPPPPPAAATAAPQDLPIDLSVKSTRTPSPPRMESEDERSASSSPRRAEDGAREAKHGKGGGGGGQEESRSKEEQEAPLDLSAARTG